jgi:hypothetical protein
MTYTKITTSLLFRIEENSVRCGGRIAILPGELNNLQELDQKGYIEVNEPLIDNAHDSATYRIFLTEAGQIEAYQLRRRLANIGFFNFRTDKENAEKFNEELSAIKQGRQD